MTSSDNHKTYMTQKSIVISPVCVVFPLYTRYIRFIILAVNCTVDVGNKASC